MNEKKINDKKINSAKFNSHKFEEGYKKELPAAIKIIPEANYFLSDEEITERIDRQKRIFMSKKKRRCRKCEINFTTKLLCSACNDKKKHSKPL